MSKPVKPDAVEKGTLRGPAPRFADLPVDEQRRQVRQADPSMRYRMIIDAADGSAIVQSLPAQDLFLTIKELGREEVPELIAMASAEQLTAFVDLDCWRKDRIDGPEALQWLALSMIEGEEKVLETAQAIDGTLLSLVLSRFVRVLRGPEAFMDEDNPPDQSKCIGSYELDMLQSKFARLVSSLLDCLYRLDQTFYAGLMESMRWELPSNLEEQAFQDRCERLQELGFVDLAQAGAVYAWIDPESFDGKDFQRYPGGGEVEAAPAFALQLARGRDLLGEVLAAGIDDAAGWDMVYLANKVMVADGVDFGNRDELRSAMKKVHGYLNLALEHLSHGDGQQASRLFGDTYLMPLFRLGFSLTLRLQRRAKRFIASALGPWIDGVWAAVVEQLVLPRPLYPLALEGDTAGGGRPFRTLDDLRRVDQWLRVAEATRRLFEEHMPFDLPTPDRLNLDGCQPEQVQAVGLRHFFLTALANRLLGRAFAPVPLAEGELSELHGAICRDKALNASLREDTRAWMSTLEAEAWPFVEDCLQSWDESFCPLLATRLDARFVDGLLVRIGGGRASR